MTGENNQSPFNQYLSNIKLIKGIVEDTGGKTYQKLEESSFEHADELPFISLKGKEYFYPGGQF